MSNENDNISLAVVTTDFGTGGRLRLHEYTSTPRRSYCIKQGYTLIEAGDYANRDFGPFHVKTWNVITAMMSGAYDWVWQMDADVLITNPTIKLTDFLPQKDDPAFFVVAEESSKWCPQVWINAGMYAVRCTEEALNHMRRVFARRYHDVVGIGNWGDQTSQETCIQEMEDWKSKVKLYDDQTLFNAFPKQWMPGMFCMHCTAGDEYERMQQMHRVWKEAGIQ